MRERLRRWLLPTVVVALAATVAIGLLTAPASPGDRADAIASRLRCPVCQGVSVADSPSDTAIAMRQRIDELIAAGASDQQVYDHFVGRYGRWVLLEPPLDRRTVWLWVAPAAVAAAGVTVVVRITRRRQAAAPPPLTEAQRAAVADALADLDGAGR